MSDESLTAEPARILIIADSDARAQAIVARLARSVAASVRTAEPGGAAATVAEFRPDVALLALARLDEAEREGRALRALPAGRAAAPFVLALSSSDDSAAAASLAREGVFDDYAQHFPEPADAERLAASVRLACRVALAGRSKAPARARPVVLVVEDDEFSQQLIAITLETRGVELVFETDGSAALDRIRSVRPDLVLMDYMLPGADGVELTQRLKADPALAAIPVVMLTGEARREILARSMEAGAADFIVKPFTPEALFTKLAKYLPTAS